MIISAIIIFIYNALRFICTNGSNLPIPSLLFNMIIFLGIIIFLLHNEYKEENTGQAKLDGYLK